MAQILPPWSNKIPALAALAAGIGSVLLVGGIWYYFSPRYTDVGYRPVQPVPYSHKLHAGDLAIDCRYCHASVEVSPVSNVPPTATCMGCHRVVKRDSEKLAPIRDSVASKRPMAWTRVHALPEYAYFAHNVHLAAGIGCVSCHGRVDEMEVVTQVQPLSMSWCLDCHRNPAPHRRPVAEVTNMKWAPPKDAAAFAAKLAQERPVHPPTDCSGCHR